MRLATTITLSMGAAVMVLLLGYGATQWFFERAALLTSWEREVRVLGRSLEVAVENAMRDQQEADIAETLQKLERVDSSVDVFVFDLQGNLTAVSPTHHGTREAALRARPVTPPPEGSFAVEWDNAPPLAMYSQMLVHDDGRPMGQFLLVRPLQGLSTRLQRAALLSLGSVLLLFLLVATLAYVVAQRTVGIPLRDLSAAMQQVRHGDLQAGVPVRNTRELAAVAREFNAMVEDLRHARAQVAAAAETRAQAQAHLQEINKLATLGQLSAGMAHELGSPLQVLAGRARFILQSAHNTDEVQRNARIILEQAERITRTVENVLRFTRRKPAALEKVDLALAMDAVTELLELEARRKQVRLLTRVDARPLWVEGNLDGLQQVVLNLLTNALAASPAGTTITVEAAPAGPGAVKMGVEDEGPGMPPEVQAHIFEPFFSTRTDSGGTGLGLSVVRDIVDAHGGKISVQSPRAQGAAGSRFEVQLRAAQQQGVVS